MSVDPARSRSPLRSTSPSDDDTEVRTGSRGRRGRERIGSRGRGRSRSSVGRGRGGSRGRVGSRGRGRSRGRGSSRGRGGTRTRTSDGGEDPWTWEPSRPASYTPPNILFTGAMPGPSGIAVGVTDPLACFHFFLPPELYDDILQQTNLYATQQRALKGDTRPFTPINKTELMAFIGINIAMGIVSLPAIRNYWSTNEILAHPWFRSVMSRNRFLEILRYFHVVDNSTAPSRTDPNYNKLWKIQPVITILNETSARMYKPHRQLSVDESMIGTKCRLSFIQYMKAKPVKWGVKVWVCSDAVTGYICSFSVYTGKDPSKPTHPKGLAHEVVTSLVEHYLHKGYIVYTDNFYTSPELCKDLLDMKTFTSGTVRTNRKNFPAALLNAVNLSERGDHVFFFKDQIVVVKWHDRKDVHAMSTFIGDDLTTVKRRGDTTGSRMEVVCPEIITDYNQFMGGVDLADQYICYYSVGRKNMKWWRKIVWRLHDHAIVNATVVYRANMSTSLSKPLTSLEFRLSLVHALTQPLLATRLGPGRTPSTQETRLMGKYFPYHSELIV